VSVRRMKPEKNTRRELVLPGALNPVFSQPREFAVRSTWRISTRVHWRKTLRDAAKRVRRTESCYDAKPGERVLGVLVSKGKSSCTVDIRGRNRGTVTTVLSANRDGEFASTKLGESMYLRVRSVFADGTLLERLDKQVCTAISPLRRGRLQTYAKLVPGSLKVTSSLSSIAAKSVESEVCSFEFAAGANNLMWVKAKSARSAALVIQKLTQRTEQIWN
jgi:hypothetical protein